MNELLKKLDEQLARLRPNFYASLKQGLTDEQIDVLEETYKVKLPADLRTLYKWKDGQEYVEGCLFVSFVNGYDFASLEQALQWSAECIEGFVENDHVEEDWWDKHWIPILYCEGNYICYDIGKFDAGGAFVGQQGQILDFQHDSPYRTILAPSLEAFVGKMVEFYENAPIEADEYEYVCKNSEYVMIEYTESPYPIEYTARSLYL